jgi:hypothetical protein
MKMHINRYCLNTPLCRWPPCPSLYYRSCDRNDVITCCCISWRFPRIHIQILCFLVTYNSMARFMFLARDVAPNSGTARSGERVGQVRSEPDHTWNLSTSTPATHSGFCSSCSLNTDFHRRSQDSVFRHMHYFAKFRFNEERSTLSDHWLLYVTWDFIALMTYIKYQWLVTSGFCFII